MCYNALRKRFREMPGIYRYKGMGAAMTSLPAQRPLAFLAASVIILIAALILPTPLYGGWFADFRLTDDSAGSFTSSNNARCVATDLLGNTHVVWCREGAAHSQIYYRLYDGVMWAPATKLTFALGRSENPSVAVDDSGRVLVVWEDSRDGNSEIYFKKFDGVAWGSDLRLTTASGSSRKPSLAADESGNAYVVWHDDRDGNYEIYYKMFDGVTWGADERLTFNSDASWDASVAGDDSLHIHVVWRDDRDGGFGIYYKRNDGVAWTEAERISPGSAASHYPSVAATGKDIVDVVWVIDSGAAFQIAHKSFDGISWSDAELLTTHTDGSEMPSIAAAGESLHVVWHDYRHGDAEIYYRLFDGIVWHEDERLTLYDRRSNYASVAVDDSGNAHVVWCDYRDGNPEIYSKQSFQGSWPKPEIISIDPDSATFGTFTHIADLAGTGFLEPASVWLQRDGEPDIIASDVAVESPERITCDIDLWNTPGWWDVVVKNPDQQMDTLHAGFNIAPLPELDVVSVDVDSGRANEGVKIANLMGANFFDPVSVSLRKSGQEDIVAFNAVVESPDRISCDFNLNGALVGSWDVSVENPDGGKDTLSAAFRVLPGPWSEELRLTEDENGSTASKSRARSVATDSEGKVHVVWHDDRDGNWEIYYKMRDGVSWTEDRRLTSEPATSESPAIAVDAEDNLHVVWTDTRAGSSQIYYTKYEDGGWSEDVCVGEEFGSSGGPTIAVGAGDVLHLLWHDGASYDEEVYYKKFDGAAWGAAHRVSNGPRVSVWPAVAVDDWGRAHIFYQAGRGFGDLYYRIYNGTNWSAEYPLVASGYWSSTDPSAVALGDNHILLVWVDSRGGGYELYYKHIITGTSTEDIRLTNMPGASLQPQVTLDDCGHVHLTWSDHRDGNGEIYYNSYDGSNWGIDRRLTGAPDRSDFPSIAADNEGGLHVVWHDERHGMGDIYYKNLPQSELAGMGEIEVPGQGDRTMSIVPNPVRRSARITFSTSTEKHVKLSVFDIRGRLVWNSDLGATGPGKHSIIWDRTGRSGDPVAAGVYLLRLDAGHEFSSAKIVVLR